MLTEGESHQPDGAVCGEVHRVMSQSPRKAREAVKHALPGAPVGALADQPDDAPNAAGDVPAPRIERSGEGSVEDDGPNVLRVACGVHRHEEGAVGVAPQI